MTSLHTSRPSGAQPATPPQTPQPQTFDNTIVHVAGSIGNRDVPPFRFGVAGGMALVATGAGTRENVLSGDRELAYTGRKALTPSALEWDWGNRFPFMLVKFEANQGKVNLQKTLEDTMTSARARRGSASGSLAAEQRWQAGTEERLDVPRNTPGSRLIDGLGPDEIMLLDHLQRLFDSLTLSFEEQSRVGGQLTPAETDGVVKNINRKVSNAGGLSADLVVKLDFANGIIDQSGPHDMFSFMPGVSWEWRNTTGDVKKDYSLYKNTLDPLNQNNKGYFGKIGIYLNFSMKSDVGNPDAPAAFTVKPTLRFEAGGWTSQRKSRETLTGFGVAELDLVPGLLLRMPMPNNGMGYYLPLPGTNTLLNVSDLVQALPDSFTKDIPALDANGRDAAYVQANGAPNVLELDTEGAIEKIKTALAPYVPEGLEEQAMAAMAYAPMAMTTAQYAPTAYRTARVAQMINTAVRSGTARSLIADSGPAIVYSAGIAMTIQTLTNPAVVSYAMTGEQNPALSITASLDDALTEVSPWAFDKWVEDKDATYPDLLQILQSEIAAPERTGQARSEATGYIQNTPALRYLDGLEGYAKTHGLDGLVIGSAAAIAEDLVQNASAAERPQIIADLENQFGLIRDQDDLNQQGGWWVTASDVDQGDGKPMADQSKLWDKLAALWRSEFKQRQIDRERAVEVISTFAQNLGLHITPEIAGKIADKARA